MDDAFVAAVVEVDEIFLPVRGEGGGVDRVAVVLRGDVAASRGEVEGGDVVGAVAVFEFYGAGAAGEGEELVAEADAHDGDLGGFHEALEVVDGVLAVGGVPGPVGDEDAVEVVGDLVDGVVVGEAGDACAAADEGAEDVFFDAAVDDGDVGGAAGGGDVEGRFGADFADQIDLLGVDKGFVLIGVVFFADGDAGEGRALFTKVGYDCTSVDTRDGGHAFFRTPFAQAFDGGPVAVLFRNIGHDDAGGL